MDFLATAKEITNWIIEKPDDIVMSVALTAGVVALGVGLGYGIKWLDKKLDKLFEPRPHIKRVKLPKLE
ncbi:MAG: hypothetical protein EOM37_05150 [Proteobacteria bacterium]|jgi:hypothetical protein|nr:hypothetical protein [Alphaproteobacteria bacterium]NCC03419.1 hypothetical protein [Pseudomonadota bacterium]